MGIAPGVEPDTRATSANPTQPDGPGPGALALLIPSVSPCSGSVRFRPLLQKLEVTKPTLMFCQPDLMEMQFPKLEPVASVTPISIHEFGAPAGRKTANVKFC